MTLAPNEMCLTDAVEHWWDNNIEKIKKKLGRDRWINEFENTAHGNSDYLQKAVSNALVTKKYDWDTYDIINQIAQDDIAEVLANLAYQDLIRDDEWRNMRWDSFEESYNEEYKGDYKMDKKLEARIARLEKALKTEDLDTANDMQMEHARNVSFLADEMMRAAADIEKQAEASGDENLYSAVYKTMSALRFVKFYLKHKLR